jgi:AAA domain, putative AbiEii toxin, Type IV TA system
MKPMFTFISFSHFRSFEEFSIEALDRVNLITGKNNLAKTALLEGMFLLIGATNIALVANISALRGFAEFQGDATALRELLWDPLFTKFDSQRVIKISGMLRSGGQRSVELQVIIEPVTQLSLSKDSAPQTEPGTTAPLNQVLQLRYTDPAGTSHSAKMFVDERGVRVEPAPLPLPFPGFFLAARRPLSLKEEAERFGRLEVAEESSILLETLRLIEPRLKRLTTIFKAGLPVIYGDIRLGRLIPLPLMGDGLGRLMSLILAIANAPHGVVLIDEIENGLHHSVLTKIWRAIGDAARRFDTQVLATTHSFECIQAAHQAFEESEHYDFRLHRLERIAEKIQAVTYDQETLAAALEIGLEVR